MISGNTLIEMFYESVKHKYPDVSLLQMQEACRSAFIFLRRAMSLKTLPKIRFMYLGIFQVKAGKARACYKALDSQLERGKIVPSRHKELKEMLKDYRLLNPTKREKKDGHQEF